MAKAYSVVPCRWWIAKNSASSVARGTPLSAIRCSSIAPKAACHMPSQSKRVLSMSVTRTVAKERAAAAISPRWRQSRGYQS